MMIDIKQVTQVNARWIFAGGERIKTTPENVREVLEQAKTMHKMYNTVINDLSPIRDDILHTMQYHMDKSKNALDRWTQDDNKILAIEFLHKLDGIDISIDYLRALSDRYYKIEIQAYNVMRALNGVMI